MSKLIKFVVSFEDFGKKLRQVLLVDDIHIPTRIEEIIVVPDDYLFLLPFEALPSKRTGRHLILDYKIAYSFSIEAMVLHDYKSSKPSKFVGFSPMGKAHGSGGHQIDFKPLMNADEEIINASNTLYAFGMDTVTFLGKQATVTQFTECDYEETICHIATHASFDMKKPWNSYVQFQPDSVYLDGAFTLKHAYETKTAMNTLILSACNTGFGISNPIEGVISFGRAFSCGLVHNVVFSLWNLEDKVSQMLFSEFYKNVALGDDLNTSLSKAKCSILQRGFEHPFFWASLILYRSYL